ncbi:MAG: DUF5777 family beta-barrel protein [Bacteroidales bacterium]|nr:DUF5777 family beta-barrel protein [Bacteroidales bacterium]
MIRNKILAIFLFLMVFSGQLFAQDLMDMLKDETPKTNYAYATFKTTRVVLGQSVESPAKGTLQFLVEHNFGKLNEGAYAMWGLDQSTVRLGLEYGIKDWLSVSIGRSSYQKTFDGSVKIKLLRQSTGARKMPFSMSLYGGTMLNSLKWTDQTRNNYYTSRLSYLAQVLIARKFSNAFSVQLTPTYIHKNLVPLRTDRNDQLSIGIGGRYKVSQRTSLNAEYFYQIPGFINSDPVSGSEYRNCLSVGVDLETGGHVFQFRLTNAQPMFERAFITETTSKWTDGGIFLGFTINRVFTIIKPSVPKE